MSDTPEEFRQDSSPGAPSEFRPESAPGAPGAFRPGHGNGGEGGWRRPPHAPPQAFLTITEGDDILLCQGAFAAQGAIAIHAVCSVIEAIDALLSSASFAVQASFNSIDASDGTIAASVLAIQGTSALAEAGDGLSSNGGRIAQAALAVTESPDTISADGSFFKIQAAASLIETSDGIVSAGAIALQAAASPADAGDGLGSSGALALQAAFVSTEGADTCAGGSSFSVQADLAGMEAGDANSSAGVVALSAKSAENEAYDVGSLAGNLSVTAAVSFAESMEVLMSFATLRLQAIATLPEGPDNCAGAGSLLGVNAALALAEASDASGSAGTITVGAAAAVSEGNDSRSLAGNIAIMGALAIAESGDTLAPIWVTGYYGAQNGFMPISAIPWDKYTHIIHFAAVPNSDGTVAQHYLTPAETAQIISTRPPGKKVLVTIKDNDPSDGQPGGDLNAFSNATAPGVLATFVANIVSLVNNGGYDGVDFDWEKNINPTQYGNLITRVRAAMPSKIISCAVGNWGGLPGFAAANYTNIDQINVMCYDMDSPSNGYTWFNDALFQFGDPTLATSDWRIGAFLSLNVPAPKIGIGMPFYGRRWTGVQQPQVVGSFPQFIVNYADLVTDSARWQSAFQAYDNNHKANYLSIPTLNEFISYTGIREIGDIKAYLGSAGFGGFMTFALHYEYLSGQTGDARYPLSAALLAV